MLVTDAYATMRLRPFDTAASEIISPFRRPSFEEDSEEDFEICGYAGHLQSFYITGYLS